MGMLDEGLCTHVCIRAFYLYQGLLFVVFVSWQNAKDCLKADCSEFCILMHGMCCKAV